MLALKLVVFALIVFSGVLGRDTRRGNTRYRQTQEEYKYNHPPVPDNYEAIPVAVVYEDQSNREDKSVNTDITTRNNVEEVSKETPKSEPTVTKEPSLTEVSNDENTNTELTTIKQEEPKPTTYRPQKEHQIPVAIIYEPETINYQKPTRNNNRGTNKRRKIQRPAQEEKQTADEANVKPSAHHVNGHSGTDSIPSANKRNDLNGKRKIQRPAPEKQTIVENNTLTILQDDRYIPLIPTSDKPEELYISQRTQNPATTEIATTNEPQPSTSTAKQPEDLNNRRYIQRPVLGQIQTVLEDNTSTSEYRKPSSVPKPERSEIIKNTEDTTQHTKRGNSTRVREVIPIVQSENIVFSHSGNFKYSYEGGDGTKAFEAGELKTFDDDTAGEAVSGGFSYTAKDGNEYSLSYTADENGYRPVGAHLPTPPPIPPAIARALAYLATKTTPEPVTESISE